MTLSRNARRDIYRTNVQMISGVIVNGTLTYFMFGVSPLEAAGYSAIFFVVGWIRQFAVSSYFRHKDNKEVTL